MCEVHGTLGRPPVLHITKHDLIGCQQIHRAFLRAVQVIKNLPVMQEQEKQIWSLGGEDSLKGMATHSCILAIKNPMDREAWWAIVHGVVKSQT